jgi:hypothetical protein
LIHGTILACFIVAFILAALLLHDFNVAKQVRAGRVGGLWYGSPCCHNGQK